MYSMARELGFASPRHWLRDLTVEEYEQWDEFFDLEAERMTEASGGKKKRKQPNDAAAFTAWKALAEAKARQRGDA